MHFKVYPNPFNKNLTIEFEAKEKSQSYLTIYDINGKQVYFNENIETIIGKNSLTITEFELQNGLYFINLLIEGNLLTYKVLCTK